MPKWRPHAISWPPWEIGPSTSSPNIQSRETAEACFVGICDKLQLLIKAAVYEKWGARNMAEFWSQVDELSDGGFASIARMLEDLRKSPLQLKDSAFGSLGGSLGRRLVELDVSSRQCALETPIEITAQEAGGGTQHIAHDRPHVLRSIPVLLDEGLDLLIEGSRQRPSGRAPSHRDRPSDRESPRASDPRARRSKPGALARAARVDFGTSLSSARRANSTKTSGTRSNADVTPEPHRPPRRRAARVMRARNRS